MGYVDRAYAEQAVIVALLFKRLDPELDLPKRCGAKRGPRAYTTCELPPGHEDYHLGRSRTGKWFSW